MKQTAVDWLEDNLIGNPFSEKDFEHNRNVFKKAKEMEKEQIKQAYLDSSRETCLSYGDNPPHDDPKFAEKYYQETFNTKKE
jgi:hypothetical protein